MYAQKYTSVCQISYCCVLLQFVKKAPEDVVLGVQEKATEAEEKINLTKKRLEFLRTNVVVSQ